MWRRAQGWKFGAGRAEIDSIRCPEPPWRLAVAFEDAELEGCCGV